MKGLLLDSNVLLWWLRDDARLSRGGHGALIDATASVAVSVVSPWELWIKNAAGRLVLGPDLASRIEDAGFQVLTPTLHEAEIAARLPMVHKDPFDRMIVAQALVRGLTLMTGDAQLPRYGVRTIQV